MKGSGKGFVELRAVTRGGSELLSVRVIGASPRGEQQWQFGEMADSRIMRTARMTTAREGPRSVLAASILSTAIYSTGNS